MGKLLPLRVLILEDKPADAELMVDELRQDGFEPEWGRVDNEADYLAHLEPAPDIVLADYNLPQWDAPSALRALQERGLDVPFIMISGTVGEAVAVECMKLGVADYLLKDRLARLGQAVLKALEDKRLRVEKQGSEAELARYRDHLEQLVEQRTEELNRAKRRLEAILNNTTDGIVLASPERGIEQANSMFNSLFACQTDGYFGQPLQSLVHPEDRDRLATLMAAVTADGVGRHDEYRALRTNDTVFDAEIGLGYFQIEAGAS